MALNDLRLSLMAFPQRWDGANLHVNVLLLPVGDPLQPLTAGAPPFAGTQLHLQAAIAPGLDSLPAPGAAGTVTLPLATPVPPDAVALFQALPGPNLVVASAPKAIPDVHIKKALPQSYMDAFPFERPRTPFAVIGDEFGCSIRGKDPGKVTDPPPPPTTTWGQLLSFALRQPLLAEAVGMLYRVSVAINPAGLLQDGGWVYVTLDTSNPAFPFVAQAAAQPDLVRQYAARIPPLSAPRALFGAALVPVAAVLPNPGFYDEVQAEAADYDDGFAKVLHAHQPDSTDAGVGDQNAVAPGTDAGIQIGWDDEQVTIWHNRSLDIARDRLNNTQTAAEAPLGVIGYRVDAREAGAAAWNSLNHATGPINFGPLVTTFDGEPSIEPTPIRSLDAADADAWLPRYFAQWRGKSLVVNDDAAYRLTGGGKPLPPTFLQPVLPPGLNLLYGHDYEFRTRLADLTGGGPALSDEPANPAPAPITRCPFRRHVPPKSLRIETDPPAPNPAPAVRTIDAIRIRRPLLGYPEFQFAGYTDPSVVTQLIAQVPAAQAAKGVLGTNDPDVETVRITVEVRAPAHDTGDPGTLDGPFRTVYEVERAFPPLPADPLAPGPALEVLLDYRDVPHIADLAALPVGENDPLPIPRARDVRIRLTPLGHNRPNYFAHADARVGLTTYLTTRRDAAVEADLYVPNTDTKRLNAIMLQPANDMAQRLAQQLDLDVSGLTFSGRPGQRTVFGASKALRHTLSADQSAITFASTADLLDHWIGIILLDLDRDWTWDGLADGGIQVERDGQPVGNLPVPLVASDAALADGPAPDPGKRDSTRLVFFDAINPHPEANLFPRELTPKWTLTPEFRGGPANGGSVLTLSLDLPVASRPNQTPRIASAGIALAPYLASADYLSTEPRRRSLWLEFEEPPEDPNDLYFGRVLAHAPDPLLYAGKVADSIEPDLSVDPELIRVIVPHQSRDNAGLDAMTPLLPSTSSNRHFLLPLPPGMTEESLELFGFWTYEFRVGHAKEWSTAQARFGRPTRVTGIQHPCPALTCTVNRTRDRVVAAAPFATPVFQGRRLLDQGGPRSRMWALLYANVVQADGSSHRNVLLNHHAAVPARGVIGGFDPGAAGTRDVMGFATFEEKEIEGLLRGLSLPPDCALCVLAVELLPPGTDNPNDPVGADLGQERILRTSPLTPVPQIC